MIDWRRNKVGVPGTVAALEYDPNRSARIALIHYADGEKSYILAPDGMSVGDTVISSRNADIKPGNSMPLRHIPLGTTLHNIEMRKGKGLEMAHAVIDHWPLLVAVLIGGAIGTQVAVKTGPAALIRRLTALLVGFVAVRLLFGF